jgi:hypothetical protein
MTTAQPESTAVTAARLTAAWVLLLACTIGPWQLSLKVGPTAGMVAAVAVFPVWAVFGPKRRNVLAFVTYWWGWACACGGFLTCLIRATAVATW